MRAVTVSGASGMIGRRLVAELQSAGVAVTILSREPVRAQHALGEVETHRWDPLADAETSARGRGSASASPATRFSVPVTRLSRIARLTAGDQRCETGAPARWATASRPASASAGAASSVGSHR